MRTLVAIRDHGSLARAADVLCVTQSALSHQLRDLEGLLNVPLLVRKSKPIRFTSAGQCLLDLAGEVLPRVERAGQDLSSIGSGAAGRLHIALECHSCFEWLLPTVEAYRRQHPAVDLDFKIDAPFEPLDALLDGRVDIVVSTDPVPSTGVTYEPLFRYEIVLIVAPDHPLAAEGVVKPTQLEGETFITYPVDPSRLDVSRRFLAPAGITLDDRRTAELTVMIVQLVASRRGVAALPSWALGDAATRGSVRAVRLGPTGLWSDLHAAVRTEDATRTYVADFVETARQECFRHLAGIHPVPT